MCKRRLLLAAAAFIPAVALAAQPLVVHFDGQSIPMHETVQVEHTQAGPVQVKTWTWQSPQGNARIVIQRSDGGVMPAWAMQQMQAMQSQMASLQNTVAQWSAPLYVTPPNLPVLLSQPLWNLAPVLPVTVIDVQPQTDTPKPGPQMPAPSRAHKPRLKV
ncbi:conserved exported hypothetical protein [Thiomonas sp. X19]|uniref:hypothetical protein n=1 Tax=Thiomonas sp. X19 TaxID=1050370 RepID=UPI000B68E967|nr:hypothetical protein [Thiomonas sp. X19]SCC94182.1 conserved exported hypothetical protein [Thiomonas sp. X19]